MTATFGCWFLAMLLTFASLFPRNYRVDPTMIRGEGKGEGSSIGLATFFRKSAESKRRLLMISALVFWLGIGAALLVVFGQGTSGTP